MGGEHLKDGEGPDNWDFGVDTAIDRLKDKAAYDKAGGAYAEAQTQQGLTNLAGGGGGFEVSPDGLRAEAKGWYAIADKCIEQLAATEAFARVRPPGKDAEASAVHAKAASDHGLKYREMVKAQAEYAKSEAAKCGKALGVYQENEDRAEQMFRRHLGMDSGSGAVTGGGNSSGGAATG